MTNYTDIINQYTTTINFMLTKLSKLADAENYESCEIYKKEIDQYVVRQCKILINKEHLILFPKDESLYTAVLDLLGFYFSLSEQILFKKKIKIITDIDYPLIDSFCAPLLKQVNDYYESKLIAVEL